MKKNRKKDYVERMWYPIWVQILFGEPFLRKSATIFCRLLFSKYQSAKKDALQNHKKI